MVVGGMVVVVVALDLVDAVSVAAVGMSSV